MDDLDMDIEVWDCNLESWEVFRRMGTQWNVGMGGATGLNYASLPLLFDLLGTDKEERKNVFDDLQVMEYAALEQMAENKDDD